MRISLWLHGSKEAAWDAGEKAGLTGEALMLFRHVGTEHKIEYDVNPETGDAVPVKIDDREIALPNR